MQPTNPPTYLVMWRNVVNVTSHGGIASFYSLAAKCLLSVIQFISKYFTYMYMYFTHVWDTSIVLLEIKRRGEPCPPEHWIVDYIRYIYDCLASVTNLASSLREHLRTGTEQSNDQNRANLSNFGLSLNTGSKSSTGNLFIWLIHLSTLDLWPLTYPASVCSRQVDPAP